MKMDRQEKKRRRAGLGEQSNFGTFHPLVLFVYFCAVLAIAMFSMHPVFLGLTLLIGFWYSVMLGGWKTAKFHLLFAVPVLLVTAVVNPLSNHRGVTVLFYLNGNPMTLEAVVYGLASAALLIGVVTWFSCLNALMSADKVTYLFGRAAPVLALLLSMCFRFVPLLKHRFREIREGQKCMGRDFPKKAVLKKIRQFGKELSILIAWSLEAAIETSDSMEARGYGLKGRTSFHIFKFTARDRAVTAAVLLLAAFTAAGCLLGANDMYYYPAVTFPSSWALTLPAAGAYAALLLLPVGLDIKGEKVWRK